MNNDVTDRAIKARDLLGNQLYRESFEIMRAKIVHDFFNTKAGDSLHRELLWQKMNALSELEATLSKIVETGKVAEKLTLLSLRKKFKV